MKKSIGDRVRLTRRGKILRRARALGHSRANKSTRQMKRKKNLRGIDIPSKVVTKYFT